MKVYLGSDHRGFKLAEEFHLWLMENNVAEENLGADTFNENDDYVDYAQKVAERVRQETKQGLQTRGIVVCGSGVGVDIVSNKIKGIRCGFGLSEEQIKAARKDDDINILAIAADYTDLETAKKIIKIFLETPFSGEEKHKRRIEKIKKIENNF